MLRNRSRAVTTKQALMAESSPPQISYYSRPISSLFTFPRFRAFTSKINPFESECALISPTSVLDSRPSILFPFNCKPLCCHESTNPKSPRFYSPDKAGIGLADLVVTAVNHNHSDNNKPADKIVLFGSKNRLQIPPLDNNTNHDESPKSPAEFGTKTKDLRFSGQGSEVQTKVLCGMELSEDYTRVISHGPNPKTTHIFENCVVVESYYALSAQETANKAKNGSSAKLDNFLSVCYTCKKNLDQKHDIFIYRGEKAFCSSECRHLEILRDNEMES